MKILRLLACLTMVMILPSQAPSSKAFANSYTDTVGLISANHSPQGFTPSSIFPVTFGEMENQNSIQNVIAITAGNSHTCVLTNSGGVKCWGSNTHGQLGDGTLEDTSIPVEVVGLSSGVIAITAGYLHTCALTDDGEVKCWGENILGQLGNGTYENSPLPVSVMELSGKVVAITAGDFHTCILTEGGDVKCWGGNWVGQLGDGTLEGTNLPVNVTGLTSEVVAISAGGDHTCALIADGGVKCWGSNWVGQLGDGTTNDSSIPVDVVGLTNGVKTVTLGSNHTCAITEDGGVKCWGYNRDYQLGDGTTNNSSVPVNVTGFYGEIVAATAGSSHTCALTSEREVKCWGSNFFGQLGNGTTIDSGTPTDVVGLTDEVFYIAAGSSHTCAVTDNGKVRCWGSNMYGQLGDGQPTFSSMPKNVKDLSDDIGSITAGFSHTCALSNNGRVKCWGGNGSGQLGNGTKTSSSTPVDVAELTEVIAITAGDHHNCALTQGGGVKCWGDNWHGQLGDGTTNDSSIPVDVVGLSSGVVSIAAGGYHTCALLTDGGVRCWGRNETGQLGNGTNDDSNTPVEVIGLSGEAIAIATGFSHTCALIEGGNVQCWGANWVGQLGIGTEESESNVPIVVMGLSEVVIDIAAGGYHTCALIEGGNVKCWGANWDGQLGNGTTNNTNTPVMVENLSDETVAVATGNVHTCAVTEIGDVKCWGDNWLGQLGNGTTNDSSVPIGVLGLVNEVVAIATGVLHTCALGNEGGVKCWGNNLAGQLGDGRTIWSSTPIEVVELHAGLTPIAAGGAHSCALTDGGGVKCWGLNSFGQLGNGTTTGYSSMPVGVLGLESGVVAITAGYSHTCALTKMGQVKCWGDNRYKQLGDGTTNNSNVPVNVLGLSNGVVAITAQGYHTCALTKRGGVKCWGFNLYGQLGDGDSITTAN